MRRLFNALKDRVNNSVPSKQTCIATPPAVPPPRSAQTTRARSKSEWGASNTPLSEIFPFPHRNCEVCIPSAEIFPDDQPSPDISSPKNTDESFGYVKMNPVTGSLPEVQDTMFKATVTTHHLSRHMRESHVYEPVDVTGGSRHLPTTNLNTYDMPRAGMGNYDVPRLTLEARTVPINSYGSSSGHADSDDDLDFMDQWQIDEALQQSPLQSSQYPLQSSSSQHSSEIPLQSNPSYIPFEVTHQANDNYDYVHPEVFKSQVTNS